MQVSKNFRTIVIFVYNSFLNIAEHIFVPDINNPEIAKGYLSLIESKLFID